MAIHVNDPETEALVRALAQTRGEGLTATIGFAVRAALMEAGARLPDAPQVKTKRKGDAGITDELERCIRATTLRYTRLRNAVYSTKSGGSRVYQMLANHGPVEVLRRLVLRPTEGLEFLDRNHALDLSAESIALDPKFAKIIPEDIRIRARANLAIIGCDPTKT
jgi:hypothetical protein